ncbi:MAG TPA: IS701 family transposase [Mycobacterium sp.]|nr:IS701 family transposase [Mycobacterium sp.]
MLDDDVVSCSDLRDWSVEFDSLTSRVASLFGHPKSRLHSRQYLEGLLAPIERKNGWAIAEHVGEKEPKAIQRFLNLTPWDADDLRDLNLDYALENLGDPEGILIADPTGFAKKGKKSAGVQRQYSGTLGRVDNCQIGTFLAFVNSDGDRVLVDRELYIPEKSWFDDPDRCAEAGIPASLTFATRPAQVIAMIERAVQAGLRFGWFTADEEFGQNPGLREYLEDAGTAYVMAIPKTTEFTDTASDTVMVNNLAQRLPPNAWQRRACGIGTKGYRVYDWAVIDSAHPYHQYMIRRSIDDGELAFYHCYNPRREPVGELVRVAGTRWPIEECFQTGKGNIGLDNYQVRLYHAWYRHITLAMLAQTFLAVLARRHRAKKGDPHPAETPPNPTPTRTPRPPTSPVSNRHRHDDDGSA